jgi:hypothetical protein
MTPKTAKARPVILAVFAAFVVHGYCPAFAELKLVLEGNICASAVDRFSHLR